MSIAQRLFNLARAEISSVQNRVINKIQSKSYSYGDKESSEDETQADATGADEKVDDKKAEQLRQYYANLELPPGADWPEVKSAYRRLMRKYHPDRHRDNPEEQRISTELSQKLRVAYEALRTELKSKS